MKKLNKLNAAGIKDARLTRFLSSKTAFTSTLAASVLLLSACASKPDVAETAAANQEAAPVEEVQEKVVAVKEEASAPVKSKAQVVEEKVAEAPKAAEKAVEQVKAAPEPAPAKVAEKAKEEVAKPVEKAANQADALVASLAAKDKFEVIKEEAAPVADQVEQKSEKVAKSAGLVKKALKVNKSDLPVTVELWTLKKNPSGSDLIITTPTWQAGSGNYLSQIWLTLKEGRLEVNSSSDIDPSVAGSGVRVNGGALEKFDRIEGNNIAVLDGDWMERLASGGTIEVALGFFPDKSKKSPLFKSDASLDALSRLVPTYYKLR